MMTASHWNDCYTGVPHWDLGRPQPAFQDLADSGAITGRVLDAGCGTGEHVLMCAARGLDATGVDLAPAAIARAGGKARERGLAARFLVRDARDLTDLLPFDTVLDSGLLHTFADADRAAYLHSARSVLAPGGRMFVLCFSDQVRAPGGPRRLSAGELTAAFADGWWVDSVAPTTLDTSAGGGVPGWLVRATRPLVAAATVRTDRAERYLDQFCRHARQAHRIGHRARQVSVHRAGVQASLDLGFGRCALRAGADALTVRVEAADAGSLRRVQAVIGADLDRFGRREGLTVAWEPR